MKIKLFPGLRILPILLIWTTLSSAQGLEVRFGLNFSNASTEPELLLRSWTGALVGGMAEVKIDDLFFLLGGVMYEEKGASFVTGDTALFKVEKIARFSYLEFPVVLKAKFGSSRFNPYLFSGPNYGIILSRENRSQFNDGTIIVEDYKKETKNLDFNLDLGGGVEYAVKPNISLLFDIRYSLGLIDVDTSDEASWKLRGLQMIAGVLLK